MTLQHDWIVAVHEAGHAVVAWYFGMMPTRMTFAGDDGKPATTHDRADFLRALPGKGLLQRLADSSITAVELAAGGCAELAIGVEHDRCGWSSDFVQFQQHLSAIRKVCGYSYDHCWNLVSAMAKEILAEPEIWSAVEELAQLFRDARELNSSDLAAFFAKRRRLECEQRVRILLTFVDTQHARGIAEMHGMID